jgi:DHA1 family multidrug resistance protein-like MFS transporter
MGMNNAFMSLGRIAGPLWAGYALDVNLNYPYLTGAFIMAVGFVLCLFYLPKMEGRGKDDTMSQRIPS